MPRLASIKEILEGSIEFMVRFHSFIFYSARTRFDWGVPSGANRGKREGLKWNLNSETVGDEDGLDLDMLIDQETAPRIFYCIITSKSKLSSPDSKMLKLKKLNKGWKPTENTSAETGGVFFVFNIQKLFEVSMIDCLPVFKLVFKWKRHQTV